MPGLDAFRPNRHITLPSVVVYTLGSLALIAYAWHGARLVPSPRSVVVALGALWREHGLFEELGKSFVLNARALAWSTVIALVLAYSTVLPALRPIAGMVSKLRFTGMVGWGFVFTLYAADGDQLKLWMLVFGTAPFMLTTMIAVVAAIPRERFDHARTLATSDWHGRSLVTSDWRVVWEVVIRGTADQALEVVRQSAAIGWMMLTMVEGLVRAGGGIGVMMLDEHKHLRLDAVFALILVVLVVGTLQDCALASLRRAACPYAVIATGQRR